MARGLELPIKISNGRMVKKSGDDYIKQLIMTALRSGDSENPFQDLGLGGFMIFGIQNGGTQAQIKEKIIPIFNSLEEDQLARLDNPSKDIQFEVDGTDLKMTINYRNMETQERDEIEVPIPNGGE